MTDRPRRLRLGVSRREIDEATPHAQLYLDRLRHAQLALSGVTVIAFGGLVGALPIVALALPGLDERTVLGVPVAVLLLLLPYPVFVLIAWLYVRRADDLDDTFSALVGEEDPETAPPGTWAGPPAGAGGGARPPGAPG